MKDILTASWLTEMVRTIDNMYAHGWDERNGGNISVMLDKKQISEYLDTDKIIRVIPTGFNAPELDGRYFLSRVRASISRTCGTIRKTISVSCVCVTAGLMPSCCGALPTAADSRVSSRRT